MEQAARVRQRGWGEGFLEGWWRYCGEGNIQNIESPFDDLGL